ncbi:MAG: acyl-CoA dehydrogenase family protein [Proteobacteria bacterium]|nr:acyl-CoA dehydrogenase family protein [Pseudomonadota bacterium]
MTLFERNQPPSFARRDSDDALARARSREHFGGDGVVSGTPVERLHRKIRPLRIYEGTSEIQKILLARKELRKSQQGSTYQ